MILFSKPNSPDLECRDGGQVESAEAKGYTRKLSTAAPIAKEVLAPKIQHKEPVDTPEAAYERKFGKAPHHKMKLQTIIDALED